MPTFHITYPTGKQFSLAGEFRVMPPLHGSALFMPTVTSGDVAFALDPRAVVRDSTGRTLFVGCSTAQLEADLDRRRSRSEEDA